MNKVILMGRLGRDPELRYTPSGQPVASFSLAIDESYRNQGGDKVDRALWVQVVAWQKTAELASKYLHKGDQCLIDGRLQKREYEARDGAQRVAWEVVANRVEFIGGRRAESQPTDTSASSEAPPPTTDEDVPF